MSNTTTPEGAKPSYKVIADYPGRTLRIGQVIELPYWSIMPFQMVDDPVYSWVSDYIETLDGHQTTFSEHFFSPYPHLFQPLHLSAPQPVGEEPCPNCKETVKECACMRNKCGRCGGPVGNITFSVCDECWDKVKPAAPDSAAGGEDKWSKLQNLYKLMFDDKGLSDETGLAIMKIMSEAYNLGSATSTTAPVWVRADKGLPDFEKQVHLKDNVGCKRLGNFFENESGVPTLYICSNGAHEPFYVQKENFWSIYWLDESQSRLPTVEEVVEWFQEYAKEKSNPTDYPSVIKAIYQYITSPVK